MPRLDGGRGPRQKKNNRQNVTGVRLGRGGPPAVDYSENYTPVKGCPLTYYIQEYYNDNQQKRTDYKQKVLISRLYLFVSTTCRTIFEIGSKSALKSIIWISHVTLLAVHQMDLARKNPMSIYVSSLTTKRFDKQPLFSLIDGLFRN